MKYRYYTKLSFIIVLLLFTASPSFATPGTPFLVTEVHDGDTVSIKAQSFVGIPIKIERVRLIGIDAPEIRQDPWGRIAKRYLKKLISGSGWVVNVEHDVVQRDRYGRLLAYLWTKDGRLINKVMIEEGFAVLYTVPPNVKYVDLLIDAEKNAQVSKRGIWGKEGLRMSPQEWRKKHPRYPE